MDAIAELISKRKRRLQAEKQVCLNFCIESYTFWVFRYTVFILNYFALT